MSLCRNVLRFSLAMGLMGALSACAIQPWLGGGDKPEVRRADDIRETPLPPLPSENAAPIEPRRLFSAEGGDGDDEGGLTEPIIERGSGRRIGTPLSQAAAGVNRDDAGAITLNVVDADIRDVVRLVLEDGLGANYIIDPAVSGSITVRTSQPLPADDVVGILGSVLSLNGAALIDQGGLFKVVPKELAPSAGGQPQIAATRLARKSGSGIQIAPLRYADGAALAELLQPFVANEGAVQLDAARNTLLLIGDPDQVATMTDLVAMFDVDWMAGMSFGLYPLDEAAPSDLAAELDQIFGDPERGAPPGSLRFLPIDRLSALLVVTVEPSHLDRVQSWIERLDQPGAGDGQQVFVYSVQNARAADLASVLGELFDIQSSAVGEPSLLAPGLEPVSIGSSFSSLRGDEEEGGGRLDSDEGSGFGGGDFGRFGRTGEAGVSQRTLTEGKPENDTRIVADETSNSLLIRATSKEYKKILSSLRELDKQPLQVLLEATIFEVSLTDELSYGVQWFFGSGNSGVALNRSFSPQSTQSSRNRPSFSTITGFTGLLSSDDVQIAVDALDTLADINVISSPQVLVLDNQTAVLQVGDEVPIVTQTADGVEENSRIVSTVEQRQTGVILNVTPRVNASGLVILDIDQEVSDVVDTTTSGIDSPTISQRRIGTSVAVGTDQTVVLGGLIQDNVDDISTGVPFLKDIPFLGVLFSQTTQTTSRTELMILITPKVLTNQREAVEATDELRRRLRSLEPLQAKVQNLKREHDGGRPRSTDPEPLDPVPGKRESLEGDDGLGLTSDKVHVVQLGSVPGKEDAWDLWASYQRDHADKLTGLVPIVEATTSGEKPIHRLQVGPFPDFDKAKQFCSLLGKESKHCLVVERS